ncbi:MAG: hypothetical protein KatS3mg057_1800 [Herpetosiphonaceae bacterium]|nr:MAG: hypothetical protein KatS3mg057_1800 [Herpetosiphonaceae bacterium]
MYLFQTDPGAGGVSLFMGLIWLALAAAGASALRATPPSNPARAAFRRRLALGTVIVSVLGIVQLLIRWLDARIIQPGGDNLPVIDWRLWSYLILIATVAFLGYMFWYYRTRYPQEVAQSKQVRVARPARQQRHEQPSKAASTNGTVEAKPKQEPITGRRESRRERKRRKR